MRHVTLPISEHVAAAPTWAVSSQSRARATRSSASSSKTSTSSSLVGRKSE
jgi:hypothetical protein